MVRPFPTFPWIEAYKSDIDRTLLRANLGRTIEERCQALTQMAAAFDDAQRQRQARLQILRDRSEKASQ